MPSGDSHLRYTIHRKNNVKLCQVVTVILDIQFKQSRVCTIQWLIIMYSLGSITFGAIMVVWQLDCTTTCAISAHHH